MYALTWGLSMNRRMNGRANGRRRLQSPSVSGVLWLNPAMSDHDMGRDAQQYQEH